MTNYAQIEEDEDGNLYLVLSKELMKTLDWDIGDDIYWNNNKDGTYTIKKVERESLDDI